MADREEDGCEVVKCYLSDDLTSDSEDEKRLNKARREAASNKKKREANKQNALFFRRSIEIFSKSIEGQSSYKNQSEHQKSVIYVEKKDISYDYPIRRTRKLWFYLQEGLGNHKKN